MPLVTVIALGIGALCMWKVHEMSAPGPVVAVNLPQKDSDVINLAPRGVCCKLDDNRPSFGEGTNSDSARKPSI